MCAGKASPAEIPSLREKNSLLFKLSFNKDAYKVGTPKNKVGFFSLIIFMTELTVGLSDVNIEVAPTLKGKVSAFPSPYAKYNLGAEKNISSLVIFNTFFA